MKSVSLLRDYIHYGKFFFLQVKSWFDFMVCLCSQIGCDLQQQQVLVGQLLQEVNLLSQDLQGLVRKIVPCDTDYFLQFRMVTSVPQLIVYLGLNKDPSDPDYSLRQRALICYIAHAIALILRRAKTCSELGLESPVDHPTYGNIMPLLSKISIPLVR